MDASTPWRSQQLLELKQTPRPRPPAFALQNRRPSAKGEWKAETAVPVAPPPYRKDVDAIVVTAARSLGLEVGETGNTSDVEGDGEVPEGQKESRGEMKKRLEALEKRLGEREKELSLAAQIGQSLLSTNESLRSQHETLLQSLPPAMAKTVDRLSAPPAVTRVWQTNLPPKPLQWRFPSSAPAEEDADLPEDLKQTLSNLESESPLDPASPTVVGDTIRELPRRPPLSTFASSSSSSSHARSHSYARLQLQDLAEQNHTLLSRLTEAEEEDEARRRKMRKLESEIGRLRAELEKAEERREDENAGLSTLGIGFAGNAAFSEPARPVWQRRAAKVTKADQENVPPHDEPATQCSILAAGFSSGTPQPQPILRRSRRRNTDLPECTAKLTPSRLGAEKDKADVAEVGEVLDRASLLRSVSRHRSTMSMGSISSSPASTRGSGNRPMIEGQRKIRKRVSKSSFLASDVVVSPLASQSSTLSLSKAQDSKQSVAQQSTHSWQAKRPSCSPRGLIITPSDSPSTTLRSKKAGSLRCGDSQRRTLGSELGSEFGDELGQGLPGLDLLRQGSPDHAHSLASSSTTGHSSSSTISALVLALAPTSALATDSATPILPHGAFKQDESLDSQTFDLLDQAVCERSMRWADDEKDAEDEMGILNASDEEQPEGQSWALTRFKPGRSRSSERALVRRSRPARPLPPPGRPYGASMGLLGWGQAADPWENTIYPEDDGTLTPPRRSRTPARPTPTHRTRWFGSAVEDDPLSGSLSVRVRHSRSLSVARTEPAAAPRSVDIKSAREAVRKSLPDRIVGKAINVLMDVWIFMQFIVVVGVFLWVTLRKGPRAILGAEAVEKRIGRH